MGTNRHWLAPVATTWQWVPEATTKHQQALMGTSGLHQASAGNGHQWAPQGISSRHHWDHQEVGTSGQTAPAVGTTRHHRASLPVARQQGLSTLGGGHQWALGTGEDWELVATGSQWVLGIDGQWAGTSRQSCIPCFVKETECGRSRVGRKGLPVSLSLLVNEYWLKWQ